MNFPSFFGVCCVVLPFFVRGDEPEGELKIEVLYKPKTCEKKSSNGALLTMHYTGTLADGTKFDSSHDRNQSFSFQLGADRVIKGWDQGLVDMCVGEKRKLTIPPHLGYGAAGAGGVIPPGATLVFETELLDIADAPSSGSTVISHDRNQPFSFQIGAGHVIKGWDQGLADMCVGEKRKLTIPPHLGYGAAGAGGVIPPDATLVFETELLDVGDAPPPVNVFKAIDADEDDQLSRQEVLEYITNQLPAEAAKENPDYTPDKIADQVFEFEDKDKNGFISREEFSGPKHDEL